MSRRRTSGPTGDLDDEHWVALYRRGNRLIGALTPNLPGTIMKYRAMINRRASWQDV